jgi:hypothetical protein
MLKKLIITLSVFYCTAAGAVIKKDFPLWDEVLTRFFSSYYFSAASEGGDLRFEKRPDGWYATLISSADYSTVIKTGLFWSRKNESYAELDYPKVNDKNKEANSATWEEYKSNNEKSFFSILPYYGYAGWDKDIIDEYKDEKNLPDSTLYALGRAYSSYANNLLENFASFPNKAIAYKLADERNCLNEQQLKEFLYYQHKAFESYDAVNKINPDFETIVGEISLKAAHEVMTTYLWLRMFQNDEEAKKELKENLYDPFYISFAKNLLASCEKDAVLFTSGDTDTFTLLYVQDQYNFRPDVLVVNLSLLQTTRYINLLRDPFLSAKPFPFSISKNELTGNKFDVIYMKTDDKKGNLDTILPQLIAGNYFTELETTQINFLPVNKFVLTDKTNSIEFSFNKSYLLLNHLAVLEMLRTNKFARPVYFAITCGPDELSAYSPYLYNTGMALKLNPAKKHNQSDAPFDVKTAHQNLMNKFVYEGGEKQTTNTKRLILNYRIQFSQLAMELINRDQKDSALKVLVKCMQIFPQKVNQCDASLCTFAQAYFKLGKKQEAVRICLGLINDFKSEKNRWEYDGMGWEDNKERYNSYLNYLESLSEAYDAPEVKRAIGKE